MGDWRYSSIFDPGTKWKWVSRPVRFTLRESVSGTHRIGGWVGTRAGLKAVKKPKKLVAAGNRTVADQTVAIPSELFIFSWITPKQVNSCAVLVNKIGNSIRKFCSCSCIVIICSKFYTSFPLPLGATAQGELWPPEQSAFIQGWLSGFWTI
jgi:hypothetical protein